jgi:Glucodextranase, domain B
MLRLFSRPVRRGRAARAPRLGLTRLETRDCPAAPVLSMTVTPISPTQATVSGTVQDEVPQTCLVTLSGDVSGMAQVYADGTFHTTVAFTEGQVTCVATDSEGLKSNSQSVFLDAQMGDAVASAPAGNAAPQIVDFTRYMEGSSWVIEGRVVDEHPAGITVTFHSSIPELDGRTATTDADGHFEISFIPPSGFKGGTVSAQAVDAQGLVSETVYEWVG